MGRRAAELVGVLVASLITSFVTGLAISAPRDPVLYVVGALVPLALLLVYWLWIEPRADAEHLRARRLDVAVERAFELSQPLTDASAPRDAARRAFYHRLDISDLFEPDHIEAASALGEAYDTGKVLLDRLNAEPDPSAALIADIAAWENRTRDQVDAARGSHDAMSFRQPKGNGASPDPSGRRERLEFQVLLVEVWVGDERKRAGEQAKNRYR
jgi:hypothetical protein